MDKNKELLDRYIKARYTIIGIVSPEESRVMAAITEVAKTMTLKDGKKASRLVAEWTFTQGLNGLEAAGEQDLSDPIAVLEFIAKFDQEGKEPPVIFVLKDIHRIISQDLKSLRYLRDIAVRFETRKHSVILLSPELNIPVDIEKQVAVIDWSLPSTEELSNILQNAENNLKNVNITLNGKRENVVQALRGLTETEAGNVILAGVVATGELGEGILPHIIAEKKQIIRKSGILEYYDTTVTMSEIGGNDKLKQYAAMARRAMTSEARDAGVDVPKGVILVGPPGTGKSLSAKAIAGGEFPLLRLDVGKLLGGGRVGEAEGNITAALKVAEAVAPCVLWIDEIEKALADNGGASDGGVMMRVLGSLLTWMQETTAPVYTVATANSVTLRPELLSRFDDVIFVDLPDGKSRAEILKVHLAKRKVKSMKNMQEIINETWGFSGREIEKVVKFAVKAAFFEGKPVSPKHLIDAAKGIVPTSLTKKAEIDAVRRWATETQAIYAGRPLDTKPVITASASQVEI